MGFGGTVPFGGLAGGLVIEHFGITPMIGLSTAFALFLAWWADLLPHRPPGALGLEPA